MIDIYNRAINWIYNNTINGEAIICNTDKRMAYPEVTGYYIPSLMKWGYRDLALAYAKWLCKIQKNDGSWFDTEDREPYVFDSSQILKGLMEIRGIFPDINENIKRGCNWILSNMQEDGRLTTPSMSCWGKSSICSELIHLYCLSPLVKASEIYGVPAYKEAATKILQYYKTNYYQDIMNFHLLSHFYAYIMEGLLDMGETDMVVEAMEKVAGLQKENGSVPAYCDVDWVCSTGLFQFAAIWFRLGNTTCGNKAFEYACKLQNESGGWYGSYLSTKSSNESNNYFPTSEISWAVKYFLDALYYKNKIEFEQTAPGFLSVIDKSDGRYQRVRDTITCEGKVQGKKLTILDVGCGKGRYLKNLLEDEPANEYCAVDLSENVMAYIENSKISKMQGSLTCIPYDDNTFDVTYACEAMEHAIDIQNAVKEMARVTCKGGKILIIDKNIDKLGSLKITDWEQWFDETELKDIMNEYCCEVKVESNIEYEGNAVPYLFSLWIGTVK